MPNDPSPLKKSRFTFRHLKQLSVLSVDCPLRVIAHVDLDAFYAQCEMKRLGIAADDPLAVQQWQNLIAVNYPARPLGVTRHITATEARKLCPTIKLVHVATWSAGETHWAYHENPDIATSKACLDPYRAEGKKILGVFRSLCPHVEKASIDESFFDLSAMVHERLLRRFPILEGPPPYNDPTEPLPLPEIENLSWGGSHLVEVEESSQVQTDVLDWDDVAMAIGAEIVSSIRQAVRDQIGYTCSAGISSNKMLAKLGSGYKKPNQQSVVRQAAAQPFLNTFKFTKIRNLGGKLGTQISTHFKTESLPELLEIPLQQFTSLLSDDTATWLYNTIRGIDTSPVTSRNLIKSMLSAKSFRPPFLPKNIDAAAKWLKVFISDIFSRLEEEGVLEGKRRPKTMTISFTNRGGSRNRQTRIPNGEAGDRDALLRIAEGLLKSVTGEGQGVWPSIRMSLAVGGFEEREEGNQRIAGFLVRGDEAKKRKSEEETVAKLKKVDTGVGKFFGASSSKTLEDDEEMEVDEEAVEPVTLPEDDPVRKEPAEPVFKCADCGTEIPTREEEEHKDWHFARKLMEEERAERTQERSKAAATSASTASTKKKTGTRKKGGGLEKGQRRLAF